MRSATGSTVVGIAALLGGCAALLLHLITPEIARTIVGAAVPVIVAGLYAIVAPQHAAPVAPVTAADLPSKE